VLSRLPIHWRVTLAFAAVLAVVLIAVGAFLYLRFEAELDDTLDQGLRSRTADVTALLRQADTGLRESSPGPLREDPDGFAQVLDARGRVTDGTPGFDTRPLLSAGNIAAAREHVVMIDRPAAEPGGRWRLLATPVSAQGARYTTVVGASLDDRDEALGNLLALLVLGLSGALVLAGAAGYGVAGIALRPVEAMRAGAEAITERDPGRRLPVPATRDEIGRLGATLNAMLTRLDRAIRSERRFVADASHELRTPLTVLKSEVDVALMEARSPEELTAALWSVSEEADRLSRLADDLLELARLDDGRLPIRREAVDVGRLLGEVADRFRPLAAAEGRDIVVEAAGGLIAPLDRLRLEQALGNLLDNALRHGAGEIEVAGRLAGGAVELSVRDRGPGLPADFAERAFERFSRPDGSRPSGGSGLGLSITRAIARGHGGDARIDGATVSLTLPVQATAAVTRSSSR
jgi:two-component system OmpR family sensor kinase